MCVNDWQRDEASIVEILQDPPQTRGALSGATFFGVATDLHFSLILQVSGFTTQCDLLG